MLASLFTVWIYFVYGEPYPSLLGPTFAGVIHGDVPHQCLAVTDAQNRTAVYPSPRMAFSRLPALSLKNLLLRDFPFIPAPPRPSSLRELDVSAWGMNMHTLRQTTRTGKPNYDWLCEESGYKKISIFWGECSLQNQTTSERVCGT